MSFLLWNKQNQSYFGPVKYICITNQQAQPSSFFKYSVVVLIDSVEFKKYIFCNAGSENDFCVFEICIHNPINSLNAQMPCIRKKIILQNHYIDFQMNKTIFAMLKH